MILKPVYFSAFLGFLTAGAIFFLIRRDLISPKYSSWWICAALGIMLTGFFPGIIDWIGNIVGIAYPPIILVLLSVCMILIKLLLMDIDRSNQTRQIRELTQKLAVYELLLKENKTSEKKQTK